MVFYRGEEDDYEIADFEPGRCPVCGVEGSNCKSEHEQEYLNKSILFAPQSPREEDPLATFIVPERVYQTSIVGSREVKRLLYPKGARIRPEEAKRLGFLPS